MERREINQIKEANLCCLMDARNHNIPGFIGDRVCYSTKDGNGDLQNHSLYIWTTNTKLSAEVMETLRNSMGREYFSKDNIVKGSMKTPKRVKGEENLADLKKTGNMLGIFDEAKDCGYCAIVRTPETVDDLNNDWNTTIMLSTDPFNIDCLAFAADSCAKKDEFAKGKTNNSVEVVDLFYDGKEIMNHEKFSTVGSKYFGRQEKGIAYSIETKIQEFLNTAETTFEPSPSEIEFK